MFKEKLTFPSPHSTKTLRTDDLPTQPGTYLLIMAANTSAKIQIGRLGTLHIQPGFYLYIGSAFGRGGIRTRVARQLKIPNKKHWHIDYLRPYVQLKAVSYSLTTEKLECQWATLIQTAPKFSMPLPGFGASDCSCVTHLFYAVMLPAWLHTIK